LLNKKNSMKYICSSCGAESLKWSGRCPYCGEWGTLEQVQEVEVASEDKKKGSPASYKSITQFNKKSSSNKGAKERILTGYKELDRVLGRGLMDGEVVLLSGEPGVGKSTLLMQVVLNFVKDGKVLYVCGEESPLQLNSRLKRLNPKSSSKTENFVLTEDNVVEDIAELIANDNFNLVVIDSIQSTTSLLSTTRACTSTKTTLEPWIIAPIALPEDLDPDSKNTKEGLPTSLRPFPLISKTPISLVEPNLFLMLLRILYWLY